VGAALLAKPDIMQVIRGTFIPTGHADPMRRTRPSTTLQLPT
jgi:hypothetical protein